MKPVSVGWVYAIRNWRRNILPILIVGLAGLMVVYSLFITTGQPYRAHLERRAYAGGDLLVFPEAISAADHGNYLAGQRPLYTWNNYLVESPLAVLSVTTARDGIARAAAFHMPLQDLRQRLQNHPNVSHVEPVYVLPAFIASGERRLPVVLRRRDWSRQPYNEYVDAAPEVEEGVILPGFRPHITGAGKEGEGYLRFNDQVVGFYRGQPISAEWESWEPGQKIRLLLPTANGRDLDLVNTSELLVTVKGFFQFAVGQHDWYGTGLRLEGLTSQVGRPVDPDPVRFPIEELNLAPLEVVVGPALWDELMEDSGLDPNPIGLAVNIRNLAELKPTVRELREAVAPAAVFDVLGLANQDALSGVAYITVPLTDISSTWRHQNHQPMPPLPETPAWVRNTILGLVCGLATILVGGILDIVVMEQRHEYTMMRVMGYSRVQLTMAVFSQLWSLVMFGLVVTLVTILGPVLWQVNQPGLSKLEIMAVPLRLILVLAAGGLCVSLALTASAVGRLLSRPMWEVLRS